MKHLQTQSGGDLAITLVQDMNCQRLNPNFYADSIANILLNMNALQQKHVIDTSQGCDFYANKHLRKF